MATCIALDQIESWEFIDNNEVPEVYDITVQDNHNYYLDCGKPILVHNSGKTYSLLQFFWANMAQYSGVKYSAVRQSMPTLKGTVIPDFVEIGRDAGLYKVSDHNLSEQYYKYNGNELRFFSGEDEEKIRGRKQDILYMNEAPELEWGAVEQLLFRTSGKVFMDYNPSYPDSWVYDNILSRPEVAFIKTTFKDNPFVTKRQLDELEWMRINNPEGYLIYGLGQRGEIQGQIYTHFRKIKDDKFPKDANIWVIDFGFSNDPMCISRYKFEGRTIYGKELFYKIGQSNLDTLIHLFFLGYDENRGHVLIADGADPQNISEIRYGGEFTDDYLMDEVAKHGYQLNSRERFEKLKEMILGITIIGGIRGPGSVRAGIKKVQSFEVLITEGSRNAWAEYNKYRYKLDRFTGRPTREPIDKDNHFMDTLRMAALGEGRQFFP